MIAPKKRKRVKKTMWCRKWLQRRAEGQGVLTMLNDELLNEDPASYRNFLRLTSEQFDILLVKIGSHITKQDTVKRESISVRSRLEVTLRFLATGESYRSLMYSTRIHESSISRIVPEVCKVIFEHLTPDYLVTPTTVEIWRTIANDFYNIWQFPQCLGALDGKHIKFKAPRSDGSYYFNYKNEHSIVLMGLADAKYRFLYVNVGVNRRISVGGVFRECKLSQAMMENKLNFPAPIPLPGRELRVPFVVVADNAFPLLPNLLKPYSQSGLSHDCRIFNYRLSRARRIIENAFGILANRFRVLLNTINLSAEKAELITLACVVLHNFLATHSVSYVEITPEELVTNKLETLMQQTGNRPSNHAFQVREKFKNVFCSAEGTVPWQENSITNYEM
ncbi:hypothetical protein RI129_003185 [Pyrocoelia pectoralis]|uniref:DDE Tnp4 domain-containing protein n=1 Tax=Pyrocoelia pectoralis TaxID=417401 RepID=A0AAN7ZUP9_9COLE